MTTYILHGGETKNNNIHNRKFFRKMLSAAKGGKILAVYFAQPKMKWNKKLMEDEIKFKRIAGEKPFELIVASDDLKVFKKQLARVKSVYIRGGKTDLLKRKLRKIEKDLPKLFSGKTVAGSSAGAYLISKYHYSNSLKKIQNGSGLLPVKVHAHYKSDRKIIERLKKHKENLRVYALRDHEFTVLKSQ